jgi:hypothetical protein
MSLTKSYISLKVLGSPTADASADSINILWYPEI